MLPHLRGGHQLDSVGASYADLPKDANFDHLLFLARLNNLIRRFNRHTGSASVPGRCLQAAPITVEIRMESSGRRQPAVIVMI